MKAHTTLLVLALVLLFTGFTESQSDSSAEAVIESKTFYYPASTINTIMSEGNGLRLYNGYFPSNGGETLMAVSLAGDRDNENVFYYLATAFTDATAEINEIDKEDAVDGCRNLETANRFAVTLGENEVGELMSQKGTTGLAFEYAMTDMGNRTLKVSPASITDSNTLNLNQNAAYVIDDPCPSSCGSDVQSNYLCNMGE
jgi:hypothetical protein